MFPSFVYWQILFFFSKLQFIFNLSLLSLCLSKSDQKQCQPFLRFSHHTLILQVHYDCMVERESNKQSYSASVTFKNMRIVSFLFSCASQRSWRYGKVYWQGKVLGLKLATWSYLMMDGHCFSSLKLIHFSLGAESLVVGFSQCQHFRIGYDRSFCYMQFRFEETVRLRHIYDQGSCSLKIRIWFIYTTTTTIF